MSATNAIQTAVQRYLDERRQLGFDLGFTGGQLMRFARFADARGHHGPLTLEIQLDWAREHVRHTGPVTWARRLEVVRPFATYYRQFEPRSEVPDLTPMATSNSPTCGHSNSSRQDGRSMDWFCFPVQ